MRSILVLIRDAQANRGEDEADIILMAVGIRPDTELARRMGIPLGKTGAIQVNFSQQTPREGVYAVGDCAESFHGVSRRRVNIPLGDIANKQGRVGAVNRINTIACTLWAELTLDDAGWLDLAYAPPFGGSRDPIHIAAQALKRK